MNYLQICLGMLLATVGLADENMSCQPPSDYIRILFLQDVSPDMKTYIDALRNGVFQKFIDWVGVPFSSQNAWSIGTFTGKNDGNAGGSCFTEVAPFSTSVTYNLSATTGAIPQERTILDSLYHATLIDWNKVSNAGRRIAMVMSNKSPSLPDASRGLNAFDPKSLNCDTHDHPDVASVIEALKKQFVHVIFMVPGDKVAEYRHVFEKLPNKAFAPLKEKPDDLEVELKSSINTLYCGNNLGPTQCKEKTLLQLMHLQDFSWSYTNDMKHLRAKMPNLMTGLTKKFKEAQFGLGTFVDKPIAPSGYPGDYCFREEVPFTKKADDVSKRLNEISILSGRDWKESHFDAIRDSINSKTAGWIAEKRVNDKRVLKVILLATDAGPHVKGDQSHLPATHAQGCLYADYPSEDDISEILSQNDVIPVFVVTSDIYNYWTRITNRISSKGKVIKLADPTDKVVTIIEEWITELCTFIP